MSEPDASSDQTTDDQSTGDHSEDDQSTGATGDDREGSILEDGGVDTDERAGRSLGIDPQAEPDEETKDQ